jgi:ribosome maturation factor RimP
VRTTAEKQRLIELLEPAVGALGFELVDIDLRLGRHGLLRLYIDRRSDEDGGVTLADCELVSGQVGALLDVEDPLPGAYDLEVSSPGLDRKLRTREHFERFVGRDVRVELAQPRDGRKRLKGRLEAVDGAAIVLDVDGAAWRVELADIGEARLVPPKSA